MWDAMSRDERAVRCRVGSLENRLVPVRRRGVVRCRVGSLEINGDAEAGAVEVRCRVGSLESHRLCFGAGSRFAAA